MVVVNSKGFEGRADIPLFRPNDQGYSIEDIDNGSWIDGGRIAEDQREANRYFVKYHPSYSLNRWMVVEGTLGNGKKYPVVLDTGASPALFVNDIHILENKLAIYPLNSNDDDSTGWGICHLPKLRIGKVTFTNWPCFYREQHTEVRVFGLPVTRGKAIIAGLPALRRFKYVAFDSINKEVEFSFKNVFEPDQENLWAQYSFVIEEDLSGNTFLFVKIPIAGKETELQLDTGSGRGLAISQELWEGILERIQNVKLRKGRDLYPYIGRLTCKRGVIPRLEVGNRTVSNAKISIFPNDSSLIEQCGGLLGMQYFRDTVMVLDFERNLMWVKNPKRRQLTPASF
jgi:hypothetical protein